MTQNLCMKFYTRSTPHRWNSYEECYKKNFNKITQNSRFCKACGLEETSNLEIENLAKKNTDYEFNNNVELNLDFVNLDGINNTKIIKETENSKSFVRYII